MRLFRLSILVIFSQFIYGCASTPSVNTRPTLGKTTFLDLTNQDQVYALFSLTENQGLTLDKLVSESPTNLASTYSQNRKQFNSGAKTKKYADCIVLRKNRVHKSCVGTPIKGSMLTGNRLTSAGLISGAIMSPFIIFEAVLQTISGDTKGARAKVGQFDATTIPVFDQKKINNIGDTILKQLTDGYTAALQNGSEAGYLISITRTQNEALDKARSISLSKAQDFLNYLGMYLGKVDGISGQLTASAISQFQRQHKLNVTGGLDTPTKITMVDQFKVTEFNYQLASRANTINAYQDFISENPKSKFLLQATQKKDQLVAAENKRVALEREKQAKINREKRLAREAKKRKEQDKLRSRVLREISNANWERGDLAYVCRKKFFNLFSQWETCKARVLEVTASKAHVEFEFSCGIGINNGDTRWLDRGQLMPRSDCDSYMHLIE